MSHCNLGEVYLGHGDRDAALREYEITKGLDENLAGQLLSLINNHDIGKSD